MIHSQSSHSGAEILEFIRKHAKVCWQGWSDAEILSELETADKDNCVGIASREGKITGVVIGQIAGEKLLHIKHIEVLRHEDLQVLILLCVKRFPGWTLTSNRFGKFHKYDTVKLLKRLYGRRKTNN